MNKIGRRSTAKRVAMTMASGEFVKYEPQAKDFIRDSLSRKSSEPLVSGRWLAWRPIGPAEDIQDGSPDDFMRNVVTFARVQLWEWRFIGRRKRR